MSNKLETGRWRQRIAAVVREASRASVDELADLFATLARNGPA